MKLSLRNLNETELKESTNPEHPCVAIILIDESTGKEITLSYLYLMRAYAFQIGGLNAQGCSHVSTIIGFGNIIHAFNNYKVPYVRSSLYSSNVTIFSDNDNSIVMELLNGQATICVMQLIQRYTNKEWLTERIGDAGLEMLITSVDETIGRCFKGYGSKDTVWQKFIRDSMNAVIRAHNANNL